METKFINAGMYVLAPEVIEMVPGGTDYDMNQLIENVIRLPEHRVGAFVVHEYWMDIGTDATYQQAETDYRVHFAH